MAQRMRKKDDVPRYNKDRDTKGTLIEEKKKIYYGSVGKPTNAQRKLMEMYSVDNPDGAINNTIEDLIDDQLPKIKKAIEDLEEYGNANVFKVLPKELDALIRDSHMIISDMTESRYANLENENVIVISENQKQCSRCGKYKNTDNDFLESKSDIYDGCVSICNKCLRELFDIYYGRQQDIREVLILLSQKIDMFVRCSLLDKWVEIFQSDEGAKLVKDGTFFINYVEDMLATVYKAGRCAEFISFSNSNFDGVPFESVAKPQQETPIYNDNLVFDNNGKLAKNVYENLKRKWEIDDEDDLIKLENNYQQLKETSDLSDTMNDKLAKHICFEELNISKLRKEGKETKNAITALRQLISDLKVREKKDKASSTGAMFEDIGSMIRIMEQERPIIHKDPELSDVDGVKVMMESLVGALNQTMGRDTEYVEKMKKHLKPYSVDIEEIMKDD